MYQDMWFEPSFNEKIKTFILENPPYRVSPNGELDCFTQSYIYCEMLLAVRRDLIIRVCEGLYLGDGRPVEHFWLKINGHIFDPTSAQFLSRPRPEFYQCEASNDRRGILKMIPHVDGTASAEQRSVFPHHGDTERYH
jgi:hypothetical protein